MNVILQKGCLHDMVHTIQYSTWMWFFKRAVCMIWSTLYPILNVNVILQKGCLHDMVHTLSNIQCECDSSKGLFAWYGPHFIQYSMWMWFFKRAVCMIWSTLCPIFNVNVILQKGCLHDIVHTLSNTQRECDSSKGLFAWYCPHFIQYSTWMWFFKRAVCMILSTLYPILNVNVILQKGCLHDMVHTLSNIQCECDSSKGLFAWYGPHFVQYSMWMRFFKRAVCMILSTLYPILNVNVILQKGCLHDMVHTLSNMQCECDSSKGLFAWYRPHFLQYSMWMRFFKRAVCMIWSTLYPIFNVNAILQKGCLHDMVHTFSNTQRECDSSKGLFAWYGPHFVQYTMWMWFIKRAVCMIWSTLCPIFNVNAILQKGCLHDMVHTLSNIQCECDSSKGLFAWYGPQLFKFCYLQPINIRLFYISTWVWQNGFSIFFHINPFQIFEMVLLVYIRMWRPTFCGVKCTTDSLVVDYVYWWWFLFWNINLIRLLEMFAVIVTDCGLWQWFFFCFVFCFFYIIEVLHVELTK